MEPTKLPVYEQKQRILDRLGESQVIVVESPTGSGKTTQIPQILYEAGYAEEGVIGVTQPRRIAAVSVSEFIARQLGKTIPDTVGYKMRFEDRTDLSTKIKIMTDGILLQEIKADYYLSRYSVIMVDEAHERSLNIDFILGLLKRILRERPRFKVIISSATINAEVFSEYFDHSPIVKIEARPYPVQTIYDPPQPEGNYDVLIQKIGQIVDRVISERSDGDFLIFLPGERAIRDCIQELEGLRLSKRLQILPLYARLTSSEQEKVFEDFRGKAKVVVATNIAETSVTIDGIKTVIDPGLAKMNFYNQRTFTSSLVEVPISKASCNQRKGRAGRTAPGNCYRLFNRKDYESRELFTLEEIFRTDLSEVVLRMAEIGIRDFETFDFLSAPEKQNIRSAIETLRLLEAIDHDRNLTRIGAMMVRFPLLPKHSRIIVESILFCPRVLQEVLTATAFLTTNSPFVLPMGEELEARKAHHSFRDPYGDFLSYLKIFKAFVNSKNKKNFCTRHYLDVEVLNEIVNIKGQLEEIVSEMGIPLLSGGDIGDYLCAVSKGLIQFVCSRSGKGIYRSLTAGKIFIHPGSAMFQENPQYIVAGEIVKTTRMYARSVSKLSPHWLKRISQDLYQNFVENRKGKTGAKPARDFTNQIKIGQVTLPLVKEKGRKVVVLPWDTLKGIVKDTPASLIPNYKGLRGRVRYEGFEFLSGVRLNYLLDIARKINPEEGILTTLPKGNYRQGKALAEGIKNLLRLCPRKKKSKRLGFLSLFSDREGNYWFKCTKGFYTALSESLSSLEFLADSFGEEDNQDYRDEIGIAYHRLSNLLETQ